MSICFATACCLSPESRRCFMTLVLSNQSVNQAGPLGTRILSLPQNDLRRESGPVSTCYMAAVNVVGEENGISGNAYRTNRALERSVFCTRILAPRSALYNQPA